LDNLIIAIEMIRNGRALEALPILDRLTEDSHRRGEALGHRAWLLRSLGRFEDAIRDYDSLLEIDPDNFDARALKAETLLLIGRKEEALECVRDAIGSHLDHPSAARFLNLLQTRSSGIDPARPEYHGESRGIKWPVNPIVEALESAETSYPASSSPEIGRFLYDFTRLTRPALALETGTFVGYSSLCIAQALKHNGRGHLHSFDLFLDHDGVVSPVLGACRDALQVARAHAEKAGLSDWITFHKGESAAGIRRHLGDRIGELDLAFIDADHSVSGCFEDWNATAPLLRGGGFAILHDIDPAQCHWMGPFELLNQIERSCPTEFQQLRVPSPEGCGLGLIQKRTSDRGDARFTLSAVLREYFHHRTGRKPATAKIRTSLQRWWKQRSGR
jgi:predicted O-methyltransferase YrrM